MKQKITGLLIAFAFGASAWANDAALWYRPAGEGMEQALARGHGRLGAMVFGRVDSERLQLNEDTVWEGYKRDGANPDSLKALPEIRRLLFRKQE